MPKSFSRERGPRPGGGRIVCLYGRSCAPWAEEAARDLAQGAAGGRSLEAWAIEDVLADPARRREVERLYVLPFEVPRRRLPSLPENPGPFLRRVFPRAEVANSVAVHELCLDKAAMAQRLLSRGVPMPETLVTHDPAEARDFVRSHAAVLRKESGTCAGVGDLVLFADDEGVIAGEARERMYCVEFAEEGSVPRLDCGVLTLPPPYFLQRVVAGSDRRGRLVPGQVLRAYVVAGEVTFWTERYRPRARRPSDFILAVAQGARYRFLPAASEAARKLARRAAEVLGIDHGIVDLVRTGSEGPYVIGALTDGPRAMIDRSFKRLPEFRPPYDFDRQIARALCG